MAKQTFTTGQVLTAAQMTALQLNDYNQTVNAKVASYTLVASDAGTRITMSNASATTITVNTSLFAAGDTLFITNIGAGASTITPGTATVSTASSLILAQYDSGTLYFTSTGVAIWQKYQGAAAGGTSGLTKIVTADFSASAAVQISNCFTSTYVNYIIVLNALGNSAGGALYMNWMTGTNTVVNSGIYYGGGWSVKNDATTATITSNGDTKFTLAPTVATNTRQNFTINCSNVGNGSQDGNMSSLGNGSGNGIATFAGIIASSASTTGVQFTGNGNLTGTYTVYGLAK